MTLAGEEKAFKLPENSITVLFSGSAMYTVCFNGFPQFRFVILKYTNAIEVNLRTTKRNWGYIKRNTLYYIVYKKETHFLKGRRRRKNVG